MLSVGREGGTFWRRLLLLGGLALMVVVAVALVRRGPQAAPGASPVSLLDEAAARARAIQFVDSDKEVLQVLLEQGGQEYSFTFEGNEYVKVDRATGAIVMWGGPSKKALPQNSRMAGYPHGRRTPEEAEAEVREVAERAIPGFSTRGFETTGIREMLGTGVYEVQLQERLPNGAVHTWITARVPVGKECASIDGFSAGGVRPVAVVPVNISREEAKQKTLAALGGEQWLKLLHEELRTMPNGRTVWIIRGFFRKGGQVWDTYTQIDAVTGRFVGGAPSAVQHPGHERELGL
jgi:peptidase YpeB-like protein